MEAVDIKEDHISREDLEEEILLDDFKELWDERRFKVEDHLLIFQLHQIIIRINHTIIKDEQPEEDEYPEVKEPEPRCITWKKILIISKQTDNLCRVQTSTITLEDIRKLTHLTILIIPRNHRNIIITKKERQTKIITRTTN